MLEGTVQILGSSLLGMTVQCARCHDHKFEPITQREYYQLQTIFWPAYCPDDWRKPNQRRVSVAHTDQRHQHAERTKTLKEQIKTVRDALEEKAKALREQVANEYRAKLDDATRAKLTEAEKHDKKERSDEEKQLVKALHDATELPHKALAEKFSDFATARDQANTQIEALESQLPTPLAELSILCDVQTEPTPHHLLLRGDYRALGSEVPPGVPQAMSGDISSYALSPARTPAGGRRTALANWLTDPRHPLVARVTVNRLWQQHFGRGIVATADNFGYTAHPVASRAARLPGHRVHRVRL